MINKELINKYWKEFVHWLDGGTILVGNHYPVSSWHWTKTDTYEHFPDTAVDSIIINDAYVEFRKALAEGKTIQWIKCKDTEMEYYEDIVVVDKNSFGSPVEFYRIKPEEPKFKVGDWVYTQYTYKNKINKVLGQVYLEHSTLKIKVLQKFGFDSYKVIVDDTTELWQPKQDEWCLFYDTVNPMSMCLSRFKNINSSGLFISKSGISWENCIPFIGTLPDQLKDT